jgi:hypothetical protein
LVHVSELLPTVDVAWLGSVSLLGRKVVAVWRSLESQFEQHAPPVPEAERGPYYREHLARIREIFIRHAGPSAGRRFLVPADYALFVLLVGGEWVWPRGLESSRYDFATVAGMTADDCAAFHETREENDGLWLTVGYSYNHGHYLCCDSEHSHFGVVADGHDAHPWLNRVGFLSRLGDSFLECLEAWGE